MEKIAIITDVNAGLDYIDRKLNIPVLRSIINFGDEHYIDGIDIKAGEFYKKIQTSGLIPSTSAPTIGEGMEVLDKLISEGYTDAIMYAISENMSCIYTNMCSLAEEYKGKINLHVINTKTATYLQGYLAVTAYDMVAEGKTVKEIVDYSNFLVEHGHSYFIVDNLNYLVKNGRLKGIAGAIGALLKIKPILEINKAGQIVVNTKIRTHSKAIETALNKFVEEFKDAKRMKLFVFHTCREDDCKKLMEKIKALDPKFSDIEMHMVTPAVGAHIGPGILGFGYYILEK